MKRTLAALFVTISTPGLVAAQDISGGVTLGYGNHDIAGQGLNTTSLDGRAMLAFANGMTLGVSAGYLDLGIDGAPFDITANFVGLDAGYNFGNGISAGVYVEQLTGSVSALPIDLTLKSIGAEVGYTTGNLQFGAHVGRTSTSPDINIDIDNVGLTAKYTPMENLDLGAAFLRATLSSGGNEIDVDMLGLAAAYDVTAQVSVFGGVSRTSISNVDADITTMGLGVGYDLSSMTGLASVVSLEVARTELSLQIDRHSVGR